MKRRILAVIFGVMTALAMMGGPAAAHINSANGKFVGPAQDRVGTATYLKAHSGIQCGAGNANSPLVSIVGGPFECPAP